MSYNYETVKGFKEFEYSHWLAIGSELINLEMKDICILEESSEDQHIFYKKMVELNWPLMDEKVFMIVPVKHSVPRAQSCMSFDFETLK